MGRREGGGGGGDIPAGGNPSLALPRGGGGGFRWARGKEGGEGEGVVYEAGVRIATAPNRGGRVPVPTVVWAVGGGDRTVEDAWCVGGGVREAILEFSFLFLAQGGRGLQLQPQQHHVM